MKRSDYETFLAVARLRNFRKAAEHLNTTQSNVSARIAGLEARLGTALFDRQPSAVFLTAAGHDLIPFAEDVLGSMEAFEEAAGTAASLSGTLRLAMSETLVSFLFPRFMEVFSQRFPKADLEIVIDSTTNQRQQLLDQSVDLAWLMGPISEFEVTNLPLVRMPLVWAVAPNHPVAERGHLTLEDLRRYAIMTYARISRPHAELLATLATSGIRRPRLFASNALSASLALTVGGFGVATLPEVFAREQAEAGVIRLVTADVSLNALEFTASYLNRAPSSLVRQSAEIARQIASAE